jgi:hypothetical protein
MRQNQPPAASQALGPFPLATPPPTHQQTVTRKNNYLILQSIIFLQSLFPGPLVPVYSR